MKVGVHGEYLGDYAEDATVHFIWDTFDSSGASITRSTDGTISVYKDNGAVQSTAGITDTEDFDSLTGIHACTIDTSADAFYATGSDYSVVLSAATIDTQTVNAVLAHFSIENRYVVLDEVLSEHQTQGTAGAALTMTAYTGPHGPGVYIDDGAANTGTTLGDDGTVENPVSTIAAATTIASNLGVQVFYLINDTVLTLAQTYEGYIFVGLALSNKITLGSQDVDNSQFHNLILTGTQGGTGQLHAFNCSLMALVSAEIIADSCWLSGNIGLRAYDNHMFKDCCSAVAGDATPDLTLPGSGTTEVSVRNYSGGMNVKSGTANDTITFEVVAGQLIVDASCDSLTIRPRGNLKVTDNGTNTDIELEAAINLTNFNAEVDAAHNTVIPSSPTTDSINDRLLRAGVLNVNIDDVRSLAWALMRLLPPQATGRGPRRS